MAKSNTKLVLSVFVALLSLVNGGICPGYENAPMQFVGGRLPEYLYIPSNFTFDAQMNILSDLPPDMVMELHLIKLGPDLEVPCIPLGEGEIGSCVYDVCKIIANSEAWCEQFPEGQPCSCPLFQGEINMVDLPGRVPDFGEALNPIMEGPYNATAYFYGSSDPLNIVGCLEFSFEFVIANP